MVSGGLRLTAAVSARHRTATMVKNGTSQDANADALHLPAAMTEL